MIGAIGSSLTAAAAQGYAFAGGTQFWPDIQNNPYAGGTIARWSDPANPLWGVFDAMRAQDEPDALWWHLAVSDQELGTDLHLQVGQALAVYTHLAGRFNPMPPLYVSAMPYYQPGVLSGEWEQAWWRTVNLARVLVTNIPGAVYGPPLGPLELADANELGPGDSHLTAAGIMKVGPQMVEFFGT